jgi:hypothetical protein
MFLIIVYFYASKELEKSPEQVLLGSEGGRGAPAGRKDPSNVCTCE